MIKSFVEAWDKHKDELRQHFLECKVEDIDTYKKLVNILFEIVINPEQMDYEEYDLNNICEIDDGNFQGTLIFIIHKDTYSPCLEEYVYTSVGYGSCSGCDTLLGIIRWNEEVTEKMVDELMDLELHLLQRCHMFAEGVEE